MGSEGHQVLQEIPTQSKEKESPPPPLPIHCGGEKGRLILDDLKMGCDVRGHIYFHRVPVHTQHFIT